MQRFSVLAWVIVCVLGIAAYACGGGEQPQKNAEVPEPGVPGGFEEGQDGNDAVGTGDDATQQGQASNSGDEPPPLPPIDWSTRYLPYIESLEIPKIVIENEPFDIILHISAQLKPDLFNGLSADRLWMQPEIVKRSPPADYSYVMLYAWLRDSNSTEPPVSELTVEVPGLPLDTRAIRIRSAVSPEWGGASSDLDIFAPHLPYTTLPADGEVREYDVIMSQSHGITVLAADG